MFAYNLEDIDKTDKGADVFNGQQSVLWKNVRAAFFEELKAMYQSLRSTGALSYDKVERMFEEHQAKWPEAIFNEDAFFKYLAPLIDEGSAAYLSMLQGSKAEQRKWWLWNRFKYIDSKYNAGDSLTDVITLRGYAKSNITVTPYADIYATVKYGSYLVQQRAARNLPVEPVCPLTNVNDTEIYISLRHTSVTYKLKLNGGDVKAVQGDSGHAQVDMVTNVFSHIIDEDRKKNAQLLRKLSMARKIWILSCMRRRKNGR